MKLYSWNVNGLRACMTKGFADFLQEAAPDIICLQETKMQREQADFVSPVTRSIGTVRSARATAVLLCLRRLSLWLLLMVWDRRSTIRKAV